MKPPVFSILSFLISFLCAVVWFGPGRAGAAQNIENRKSKATWTWRVITQSELERLSKRDRDLSPDAGLRILAKLNARDFDYIAQDIRDGKPIKVPDDFVAFKDWTPLEKHIPDVADLPKFILIVKDLPYIGWYERGKLVGDSYVCVGKVDGATREGLYTAEEKDLNPDIS